MAEPKIEETLEEITLRHKKELKELNSQITALKKTATKGDKKRKKEVQIEVEKLEKEFRSRQQNELELFKSTKPIAKENSSNNNNDTLDSKPKNLEERNEDNLDDDITDITDKLLARLDSMRIEDEKKAPIQTAKLAEMQREAEEESKNQVNLKEVESNAIKEMATKMGFTVKEISHKDIRKNTAMYMRNNTDDFMPFFSNTQDGNLFSLEQFQNYCDNLENTALWGGEIEIRAISQIYEIPIHVIQMNSPVLKMFDEKYPDKEPIIISYPL
ncbi:2240_t:CDS:2 [Diversispora eburnea]|uniref:2240_t:CDS:1 n=1 Tax=Diversispora eburnea TaxID=1213867 RepID=A0A9N9D4C3_9GLOM|nr:2240_t:CDS:2 [Diversispora eburnea]